MNTVVGQVLSCGDFFHGKTCQEVALCDAHFRFGEFVTVSQADYVLAVYESFGELTYPSSDNCVTGARQAGYLSKAVAAFQVHGHQQPVLSGEQV